MKLTWLILLAIAPSIAIGLFVYLKDKYEKEPVLLMVKCFFLGVLSIIPPIIIENAFQYVGISISEDVTITLVYAFLGVGLSEELSKFMMLRYGVYKKAAFNEPMDGIVYAVFISLGFATAENLLYVLNGGISVAILRMFTAVPAHGAFAILMGFYVGKAKFSFHPKLYMFLGLIVAALVHGLYDFFLFQMNIIPLRLVSLGVLILAIFFSIRAIRIHVRNSPFRDSIE
ncbi:MAG: PrsW family glutamic-type intramembrane protease [Bacteroidota bacterium]